MIRRAIVMAASAAMILVTVSACQTRSLACAVGRSPHPITAYVSDYGSSAVTPISPHTSTAGKPIKVGGYPGAIAITPDGTTAYVASFVSNTVTPILTSTDTPGEPIKVWPGPAAIAITPDGKTAYVASFSLRSNAVTPIRIATNTAVARH